MCARVCAPDRHFGGAEFCEAKLSTRLAPPATLLDNIEFYSPSFSSSLENFPFILFSPTSYFNALLPFHLLLVDSFLLLSYLFLPVLLPVSLCFMLLPFHLFFFSPCLLFSPCCRLFLSPPSFRFFFHLFPLFSFSLYLLPSSLSLFDHRPYLFFLSFCHLFLVVLHFSFSFLRLPLFMVSFHMSLVFLRPAFPPAFIPSISPLRRSLKQNIACVSYSGGVICLHYEIKRCSCTQHGLR